MGRGVRTPDHIRDEIVRMYEGRHKIAAIEVATGVPFQTINNILRRKGIARRGSGCWERERADVIREEAIRRYAAGDLVADISKDLLASPATIARIIGGSSIPLRGKGNTPRAIRDDAFSEVTEESAYWVGFLMADGCVYRSRHSSRITICLQRRDSGHLHKFRDFVGTPQCQVCDTLHTMASGRTHEQARFVTTSHRLVSDLGRYGVIPRKSIVARVNILEADRHFWRGVIDGDGGVYFRENRVRLGLTGGRPLLEQFRDFVRSVVPCSHAVIRAKKDNRAVQLVYSGSTAWLVIRCLYTDCSVYLDRKMETARTILSSPCPRVHFTDNQIREIRRRRSAGEIYRTIADDFGVTIAAIRFICCGQSYARTT